MALVDALLPEFDHEMTLTRTLLARVPEDRLSWKPHPKSMSLGELATHLATLPAWGETVINKAEFDVGGSPPAAPAASRAELLGAFDRHVGAARAALAGRTDAELMAPWSLRNGAHTVFTMPRAGVLRSFVFSHMIHHRGQLTVYLRMQDVPLPSIYGPSADDA